MRVFLFCNQIDCECESVLAFRLLIPYRIGRENRFFFAGCVLLHCYSGGYECERVWWSVCRGSWIKCGQPIPSQNSACGRALNQAARTHLLTLCRLRVCDLFLCLLVCASVTMLINVRIDVRCLYACEWVWFRHIRMKGNTGKRTNIKVNEKWKITVSYLSRHFCRLIVALS